MGTIDVILLNIIGLILIYTLDETLFYREVKKHCKKYKGECKLCNCWSCPRKLYKDEYMENKIKENKK